MSVIVFVQIVEFGMRAIQMISSPRCMFGTVAQMDSHRLQTVKSEKIVWSCLVVQTCFGISDGYAWMVDKKI